jgi:hypothetical protein
LYEYDLLEGKIERKEMLKEIIPEEELPGI